MKKELFTRLLKYVEEMKGNAKSYDNGHHNFPPNYYGFNMAFENVLTCFEESHESSAINSARDRRAEFHIPLIELEKKAQLAHRMKNEGGEKAYIQKCQRICFALSIL